MIYILLNASQVNGSQWSLNVGTDKWRSLLMTTTNGDLLYTKVLKKEKSNSLRDLSRWRIHSRMSLINYYFLFFFCSITVFVYFSSVYFQYMFFFWVKSCIADSDWQRAYYYIQGIYCKKCENPYFEKMFQNCWIYPWIFKVQVLLVFSTVNLKLR